MTWTLVKAFVSKYKVLFIAIGCLGSLAGAFLLGRGTAPAKTIEVVKTVEVEKQVVKTEVQVVEKKVYVQVQAKDVHRETVTVKQPDGTVTTTTVYDDKTKTTTEAAQSTSMASLTESDVEKTKSTESTKIVETAKPDWHATLRLGAGATLTPLRPIGDVGLSIERRIIGPFWLGAYGGVQIPLIPTGPPSSFTAGVSAGLEF